jgi:hypothetical protein
MILSYAINQYEVNHGHKRLQLFGQAMQRTLVLDPWGFSTPWSDWWRW